MHNEHFSLWRVRDLTDRRPVVKEEVRIRKDVVEDTEVVEEDVRREEVEGNRAARSLGQQPRGAAASGRSSASGRRPDVMTAGLLRALIHPSS